MIDDIAFTMTASEY